MEPKLESYSDPNLVPSRLSGDETRDFSIVSITAGWPDDLERLHVSLQSFCGEWDWELVVVANNSTEVDELVGRMASENPNVVGISFSQKVGFGGGINSGIVRSSGKIVVVAETSVEATGDFLGTVSKALEDSSTGLVGKWGLVSADLRHFHEESSGEVDAMQGYLMAFRRTDLADIGLFDAKYKFYRNADIDFSLRWRDKGFKVRSIELEVERHEHREWESLSPDQRESKSRDNFTRLLRTWRDRNDLLTGRGQAVDRDQ